MSLVLEEVVYSPERVRHAAIWAAWCAIRRYRLQQHDRTVGRERADGVLLDPSLRDPSKDASRFLETGCSDRKATEVAVLIFRAELRPGSPYDQEGEKVYLEIIKKLLDGVYESMKKRLHGDRLRDAYRPPSKRATKSVGSASYQGINIAQGRRPANMEIDDSDAPPELQASLNSAGGPLQRANPSGHESRADAHSVRSAVHVPPSSTYHQSTSSGHKHKRPVRDSDLEDLYGAVGKVDPKAVVQATRARTEQNRKVTEKLKGRTVSRYLPEPVQRDDSPSRLESSMRRPDKNDANSEGYKFIYDQVKWHDQDYLRPEWRFMAYALAAVADDPWKLALKIRASWDWPRRAIKPSCPPVPVYLQVWRFMPQGVQIEPCWDEDQLPEQYKQRTQMLVGSYARALQFAHQAADPQLVEKGEISKLVHMMMVELPMQRYGFPPRVLAQDVLNAGFEPGKQKMFKTTVPTVFNTYWKRYVTGDPFFDDCGVASNLTVVHHPIPPPDPILTQQGALLVAEVEKAREMSERQRPTEEDIRKVEYTFQGEHPADAVPCVTSMGEFTGVRPKQSSTPKRSKKLRPSSRRSSVSSSLPKLVEVETTFEATTPYRERAVVLETPMEGHALDLSEMLHPAAMYTYHPSLRDYAPSEITAFRGTITVKDAGGLLQDLPFSMNVTQAPGYEPEIYERCPAPPSRVVPRQVKDKAASASVGMLIDLVDGAGDRTKPPMEIQGAGVGSQPHNPLDDMDDDLKEKLYRLGDTHAKPSVVIPGDAQPDEREPPAATVSVPPGFSPLSRKPGTPPTGEHSVILYLQEQHKPADAPPDLSDTRLYDLYDRQDPADKTSEGDTAVENLMRQQEAADAAEAAASYQADVHAAYQFQCGVAKQFLAQMAYDMQSDIGVPGGGEQRPAPVNIPAEIVTDQTISDLKAELMGAYPSTTAEHNYSREPSEAPQSPRAHPESGTPTTKPPASRGDGNDSDSSVERPRQKGKSRPLSPEEELDYEDDVVDIGGKLVCGDEIARSLTQAQEDKLLEGDCAPEGDGDTDDQLLDE